MGNIVMPNGTKPVFDEEPVDGEEDHKDDIKIKIIPNITLVTVDEKELDQAVKEYRAQSGIMVDRKDVRLAVQKTVAEFANWFALTYPKLKHTVDNALSDIGYKLGSIPEEVAEFNRKLHE